MTMDAESRSEHPNLVVVTRVGEVITNGFDAPDASLFADDFVFHYFNSRLPDLAGDHHGFDGIRGFFARLDEVSGDSFHVEPVSLTPFGDELVAAHATITLSLDGAALELDALPSGERRTAHRC